MPNQAHLYSHIEQNAEHAERMAVYQPDIGSRTVAICGAGPSLADSLNDAAIVSADELWACNSALPYLYDRGRRVTHGFCIDQGVEMLLPHEWGRTFPVDYYVASSVHPSLVRHLRSARRRLTFFHSFLGIPEPTDWDATTNGPREVWLYQHCFGDSICVGHGLNAVPRAVCLALALGFGHITVYGADSACRPDSAPMPELGTRAYAEWMRTLVMYADGRTAGQFGTDAVMAEAMIDGVRWHTRPDMVVSAQHLLQLTRQYPGRITLVGHTLPNALAKQDDRFMSRLPMLSGAGKVTGFGNAALVALQNAGPGAQMETAMETATA